ncbi:hypothetical protein BTVI_13727 [Pitangus sulphuratus]|nr:hypothetical protein BTVI_13727 [Pitangus sulphuratus]
MTITEMWWDDLRDWSATMDVYTLFKRDRTTRPLSWYRDGETYRPHAIQNETVSDLLCHLDSHKSMAPDRIHPRVTHLVHEEKAVDVVYLDFSKTFDTVSNDILLENLAVRALDRQCYRLGEEWLENCAVEKDLSQKCAQEAKKASAILACIKNDVPQQDQESDCSPVLSTDEVSP